MNYEEHVGIGGEGQPYSKDEETSKKREAAAPRITTVIMHRANACIAQQENSARFLKTKLRNFLRGRPYLSYVF